MTSKNREIIVDEYSVGQYMATGRAACLKVYAAKTAVDEIAKAKYNITYRWLDVVLRPDKAGLILVAYSPMDKKPVIITDDPVIMMYYDGNPKHWPPLKFGKHKLVWTPIDGLSLSDEEEYTDLPF